MQYVISHHILKEIRLSRNEKFILILFMCMSFDGK